ncbi:Glutathione S-transferase [hydrothermal vent metagenome]|uniref:Glutathione S-transferase n=1 Tax=hydrothermal vent metagenome TaxID=652676 RepID=A0A3B0TFV1_9ZZZZ
MSSTSSPVVQSKPIELYYWATPNGRKVSIMLEELKLPYNTHFIDILNDEQFAPDFLKISPNNRIPAIVDPEGPGGDPISVFESAAVLKYLAEKFKRFYPLDWRQRVQVDEWLFWQMGGFGPMLGQAHHFLEFAKEKVPYAIERYHSEAKRLYGVMDRRLEGREFLAGEYSIADMACVGWANSYERQRIDLNKFPNVKNWYERLLERPAVKRGLALDE